MEDVEIPVRDDFQDDGVIEGLEESKKLASAHELTLGQSQLASGGALIEGEENTAFERMKSSRGPETENDVNKVLLSARQVDKRSDGQFSEYNEVL